MRKETLNEAGDTTDYVRLNHSSSGGSIELQTDVTGGVYTDTLSISSSGADISIEKTTLGTTLNITHPKGTSITISSEGQITITSPESISISSPKDVSITGVPINLNGVVNVTGIGNLLTKITSMDDEIEVAKSLPLPP
jgi:flagellar basal body rod protein FlgF